LLDYGHFAHKESKLKLIHYSEAETKVFDGGPAKGVTARVVIGRADGADHFCMRVFELAEGGYTPMHSHDWEHEIFIHAGEGMVFRQGSWAPVKPGNVVFVPGNEEHQLKNTGTSALVFVCLIPAGAPEI
jgi:quercetin dioxygenase-like cupin family protein